MNVILSTLLLPQSFGLAVAEPTEIAERPKYYVLSIGINKYEDSSWSGLNWAEDDAKRFADSIGNLDDYEKISIVITGKSATREKIETEISNLTQTARPRDIVALYFSMHGTLQPNGQGDLDNALVAFDTNSRELATTSLTQNQIRRQVNRLRAKRRLIVFATCHSGIGKSIIPEEVRALMTGTKGRVEPLSEVSEGAIVLAASSQGEAARESGELKSDLYTYYLLENLKVADRNGDGLTTSLEAHDFARDKTYLISKGKQRPTVETSMIGEGDIPLAGKKKSNGRPILTAYDRKFEGFELQTNEQLKGVAPTGVLLQNGQNRIDVTAPGDKRPFISFNIDASPGETLDIHELFAEPPVQLSAGIGILYWSDSGFEKAFGSATSFQSRLQALYKFTYIDMGMSLGNYGKSAEDEIAGLNSDLTSIDANIIVGASWNLRSRISKGPSIKAGIYASAGIESAEFSLTPENQGQARSHASSSPRFGLNTNVSIDWFRIDYGINQSNHEFGEFGSIKGNRQEVGIGMQIAIGGRATRR